MPEQDRFTFHDKSYSALGDLVLRYARDAQARLSALEAELSNVDDATAAEWEESRSLLQQDASVLGAMAVCIDPNFEHREPESQAPRPSAPPSLLPTSGNGSPNSSSSAAKNNAEETKRLSHRGAEHKAAFEERVTSFAGFMVECENMVEKDGKTSAAAIIRDGIGMDAPTWNRFSLKLQQAGILVYERPYPHSKMVNRAYMNRARVEELIQLGDLPEELEEELAKLDVPEEPEPEEDGGVAESPAEEMQNLQPEPADEPPLELDKHIRDGLSAIRTRHTGAYLHQRAKRS